MTYLNIDKAMYDIVIDKYNECQSRLDKVSKENKSERKALIIEREMYGLCNRAGLLVYTLGNREHTLTFRKRVIGQILQKYPRFNKMFTGLDEEEKWIFIAALQAEIFMRDQIVHSYRADLEAAKVSGDTKKIFEFNIKVGATGIIFDEWEKWRVENNIYPGMFVEGLV